MSFLHPEYFYYTLPVLFLFFIYILFQKQSEVNYFSQEVMEKLRVSSSSMRLKTRNILFLFVGLLLSIAIANPIIEDGEVEVKSKSADIMIALDISDSMLGEDIYPNRLGYAKQKILDLLKYAPNERIGVVAFAKNSYLVSPMSFDHNAVRFLLKQLNTDSITEKGTNFHSLLNVVNETIKTKNKKYLLMFSDGGDKDDFSEEIEYAKENNIVVFVLGVGTIKGAPIKQADGSFIKYKGEIIVSKLNENIADLATKTSGAYIHSVKSVEDVKTMLKEIEANSEQKELKSETVKKFIPLFYYPLGLALFVLLIATSSLYKKEHASLMLMLFLFSSFSNDAKAGILDFLELDKAKKAYEAGDYETSAKIYQKHADDTRNPHSYYNAGNSFYKNEKYKEAVKLYEKAIFKKDEYKANKHANLANSYAKQGGLENLEKAKKHYEESLKITPDSQLQENLENVKELIEKLKKNQEKEKKDESSDGDGDKDGQKEDENGPNEMKKKDKDGKEKSDDKNDSDKENENEDKQKQDEPKKDKDNTEEKKTNNEDKKDLDNLNEEKSKVNQEKCTPIKMSDKEQEKWMKKLNQKQGSFLYRLGKDKRDEEETDEKPW